MGRRLPWARSFTLTWTAPTPPSDPLLDRALATVAASDRPSPDIAAGDWAGAAVKKAIDAVNAGIAIIIAAGAAGAGGSSS